MALKHSHTDYTKPARATVAGRIPNMNYSRKPFSLFGPTIAIDIYLAVELFAIMGIGLLVASIYVGGYLDATNYHVDYFYPTLIVTVVFGYLMNRAGQYKVPSLCRSTHSFSAVMSSLLIAFAAVIVIGFAARIANEFSRVWLFGWFGSSLLAIIVLRVIAGRIFNHLSATGVIRRNVAIYGQGKIADSLAWDLRHAHPGLRLVGRFHPAGDTQSGKSADVFGDLEDLVAFGQTQPLDSVVLALPALSKDELQHILKTLAVLPAEIQLYPSFAGDMVPLRGMTSYDHLRLLDLQRKPMSDWGVLAKRIEDIIVAGTALVVFAPLMALCAAAIKLDSTGPVFFRQRRHGYNNNVFSVWKFRTMSVMEDGEDVVQASRGDSRVTRVGRWLRRTSLDELPQLFNVLAGDMSIVGPRPHPLVLKSNYSGLLTYYANRHRVKPGITGWAQIHGYRGPTETPDLMERRVKFDMEYIENWSLWLDVKIIAATPFLGFFSRNAL